jgi:CheY-like chemotaxis protein
LTPSFAATPFQRIEERNSFSIAELADTLGVTVQAVHQWLKSGRLRNVFRISKNGQYRIPRREFVRVLRESGCPVPGLWEPPKRRRARVLVIDGYRPLRRLVEEASRTRHLPFEVKTAQSVEDGVVLAARFMPQVILLAESFERDRLQGVQGLAFIRNARAIRKVRVIAVSASAKVGRELVEGGADAFLQKPFLLEELRDSILSQLGRHARSAMRGATVSERKA